MIHVTRLNGVVFYINPDLVSTVESTPDTVLTLTTGDKYMIAETAEEFSKRFIALKQQFNRV